MLDKNEVSFPFYSDINFRFSCVYDEHCVPSGEMGEKHKLFAAGLWKIS